MKNLNNDYMYILNFIIFHVSIYKYRSTNTDLINIVPKIHYQYLIIFFVSCTFLDL